MYIRAMEITLHNCTQDGNPQICSEIQESFPLLILFHDSISIVICPSWQLLDLLHMKELQFLQNRKLTN